MGTSSQRFATASVYQKPVGLSTSAIPVTPVDLHTPGLRLELTQRIPWPFILLITESPTRPGLKQRFQEIGYTVHEVSVEDATSVDGPTAAVFLSRRAEEIPPSLQVLAAELPVVLISDGEAGGVLRGLWWGRSTPLPLDGDFHDLGSTLAFVVGLQTRLRSLSEEIAHFRELALTDSLTGLVNRRGLQIALRSELARCRRHRLNLGLVMVDLDDFKQVNRQAGYLGGDQALQEVARRLGASSRQEDIVGRFGGDEFLVVLPETDLEGARRCGEKLLEVLADSPILLEKQELRLTACLGVATVGRENVPKLEEALAQVADALSEAKERGSGQVVLRSI